MHLQAHVVLVPRDAIARPDYEPLPYATFFVRLLVIKANTSANLSDS